MMLSRPNRLHPTVKKIVFPGESSAYPPPPVLTNPSHVVLAEWNATVPSRPLKRAQKKWSKPKWT